MTKKIVHTGYGFMVIDDDLHFEQTTYTAGVAKPKTDRIQIPGMTPTTSPLFAAAYEGKSKWSVDAMAGMSRVRLKKTTKQIVDGLLRCGFTKEVALATLAKARKIVGQGTPTF